MCVCWECSHTWIFEWAKNWMAHHRKCGAKLFLMNKNEPYAICEFHSVWNAMVSHSVKFTVIMNSSFWFNVFFLSAAFRSLLLSLSLFRVLCRQIFFLPILQPIWRLFAFDFLCGTFSSPLLNKPHTWMHWTTKYIIKQNAKGLFLLWKFVCNQMPIIKH